jgi:hypothetical protein
MRSLDTDIGYRHHARKQNGLTPISRLFGLPQEPRSLARSTNLYDFFITFSWALSYKASFSPGALSIIQIREKPPPQAGLVGELKGRECLTSLPGEPHHLSS